MKTGELFARHPGNPILTADDWPYPANAVFNPGAAALEGETVLVVRVEDMSGISHLSIARSRNGVDGWSIDPRPLLAPAPGNESEEWGLEDPRVVWVPELDRWVITGTAYGRAGPGVFLATTRDFTTIEQHTMVKHPDDKNAALLPHRIDGRWVLFHRPKTEFGGSRGQIMLSRSPDLVGWSSPEQVLQPRDGAWWDSLRIGIGPPPMWTEHGWLLIYHGVKETVSGELYRVGLALLDLDDPTRVLRRHADWILAPRAPYERTGDVPNVVFPCGLAHEPESGELRLYYGAADTSICLATAQLGDLIDALMETPPAT
jgi:predicted GH43/DUF377 family glycosyl hydrolase